MEFLDSHTIRLDKVVNDLDKFVFGFIRTLEKHADYVIISGYVSILFGRTRATEDVDIFVKEIEKPRFVAFYKELLDKGYWCLNGEDADELYTYLAEGSALRFADNGEVFPNFEVKFARKQLDKAAFTDPLTVVTELGSVKVSSIERQIAFKKYYLKSDKDVEDARHLEKVFKEHLDMEKIAAYRRLLENEVDEARKD